MRKVYFFAIIFLLFTTGLNAQKNYLETGENYTAVDVLSDYSMLSTFDIHDHLLYGQDGDTIHSVDMNTETVTAKFGKPSDYAAYPGFVYVADNGNTIWAGFTVSDNSDDRIYRINTTTGEWHHEATLTGNFDMTIINDSLLVSATTYGSPNKIYVLDTTGSDNHRELIETGGNSAGLGTDENMNLYYATSLTESNKVVRWDAEILLPAITNPDTEPLQLSDAQILTQIPAGAYDCEADENGNIIFNFNNYTGAKVLAKWNGTAGSAMNYDTLATTNGESDWFTMIKTKGDVLNPGAENGVYLHSYTRPIAKVNGNNYAPVVAQPFDIIQTYENEETLTVSLADHFTDPDDEDNFSWEIISNAETAVATAEIENQTMTVNILAAGQTEITIKATNEGRSVTASQIVGVYPQISGENEASDFENLELENNSYWNGDDGSGGFNSGLLNFVNNYNENYGSWSGWAYSNMADDTTQGFTNQYSAITAAGFEPELSEGSTYGVGYASTYTPSVVTFNDNQTHTLQGFFVTNSTYAALAMQYGDAYSKQFGGATGNDPDWFKLSVWGYNEATATDTVEYYLADYRFEDNTKDYIVKTWQWVDVSNLGAIDSLKMSLSSSDVGDWGMNTPAYYCADNFYVQTGDTSGIATQTELNIATYPNPVQHTLTVKNRENRTCKLTIFDNTGKALMHKTTLQGTQKIDLSAYPAGIYLLKINSGNTVSTRKIIKK